MKDTLYIYTRVSTSIQEEEGTSLKTQKEIGIELSERLGLNYQVHNEGGISSSKDTLVNRPVLMNILKLMDEGVVKHLYVWNTDRLSRNQITWYTIRQKMVKNGVILYTSNGVHDTNDFMENMILGILSEVSQYDNKVRAERSRLGKIEKVKLNYWRGGDCPFGYRLKNDGIGNHLVENKEESKWLFFIYSEYAKGTSLKNIKSILEDFGIRTRRGNKYWSMGSLQVLLKNLTYLGVDQYIDKKTNLVITNTIPQLISNKLWDEVQETRKLKLLRKNQINRTKKFYLFRDFLICSCGTPMGGRIKKGKKVRHYYCPLSERRFNNSYKKDIVCTMKRCLNIPMTDKVLWDKIIDVLSDSVRLKETMKNQTMVGMKLDSTEVKKVIDEKNLKITELKKIKTNLEKGLVSIETDNFLNKFPSDEVYNSLKKNLTSMYKSVLSDIDDLNNSLKQIGNDDKWFEWIDRFGRQVQER
ncbi:MAG: recombinase family protein, partial [Bacteroidales bacterium]